MRISKVASSISVMLDLLTWVIGLGGLVVLGVYVRRTYLS